MVTLALVLVHAEQSQQLLLNGLGRVMNSSAAPDPDGLSG
jgi:hypothetical protein